MTFYEITEEDKELIKEALSKLESNYDGEKYNHTVGGAVKCKNGNIYTGVNCDGIHGSCAEYITMGIAISAGERNFDTIVAVHKGFPNKVIVCCIAFGVNSGAYVSEVIRGGLASVDYGQTEAGRSLGLSQIGTLRLIVLPQAIKNILPALCNEAIAVLKETSICGLVSVVDLTRAGDLVRSRTMSPYFTLISVAIVYFILVYCLSKAVGRLERRLAQSDRH